MGGALQPRAETDFGVVWGERFAVSLFVKCRFEASGRGNIVVNSTGEGATPLYDTYCKLHSTRNWKEGAIGM